MLKLVFYLGLTAVGIVAALFSPLAGAVGVIGAYLLNPSFLSIENGEHPYQLWMTIAFLVGLVIHRWQLIPKVGREGWVLKLMWVFLAIALATSLWAVFSPQAALNGVFEIAKTIFVSTLLICAVRNARDFGILMMACLIGVLHAGLLDTFGVRFGYVTDSFIRENGVLPDAESAVFILFVPMFLLLAIFGSWKERIFTWCALPFILNGLIKTYQRAAFVGLAFQALLLLFMLPKRIVLRLIPVLAAAVVVFVFRLTPPDYWARMRTLEAPTEEGSANSRIIIANASLHMFLDHPFGVGYSNYGDVSPHYLPGDILTEGRRTAHNTFFTILCETGIFGFATWIASFGVAIWILRRLRKKTAPGEIDRVKIYAMGLELGLYGWLLTGLFQGDHDTDPAYWFLAFAVILTRIDGMVANSDAQQSVEDETGSLDPLPA